MRHTSLADCNDATGLSDLFAFDGAKNIHYRNAGVLGLDANQKKKVSYAL